MQQAAKAESNYAAWPEKGSPPETPGPADASFLRMYPLNQPPRAGSHRTDDLERTSHWHFHDMHQLNYTFEGVIELATEDGTHLVSPQVAAWIPAGCRHQASLHRAPSGSIFFPADMVDNPGDRVRGVLLTPLIRELITESARWSLNGPDSKLRSLFFQTMAGLCSEWIKEDAGFFLPAGHDPRIRRALEFTASNIEATLADVCRVAGMSERSLRRHLKAETGLTWESCRQRSRVLRAITMLGNSNAAVTMIALDCGFDTPSGFSRAFRDVMNETPSDYRQRICGTFFHLS